MCDGISVWVREMHRPENERSPTVLAHEVARSQRMADVFEAGAAEPSLQAAPGMAHLILVVGAVIIARMGHEEGRKQGLPFGPWLCLGSLVGLFVGEEIVDWYLDTFV